jgi:hypothetical protein
MPTWVQPVVQTAQLIVNVGALLAGAVVWKLYVDNLKAALTVKDSAISSVEKDRDFWRTQAQELEKRSPEAMERILGERIRTRDSEIGRLLEDKKADRKKVSAELKASKREKAELESELFRVRGFRLMLALEDQADAQAVEADPSLAAFEPDPVGEITVAFLGDVAVDSGQLMVTDPCYIDQEWKSMDVDGGNDSKPGASRPDIAHHQDTLPPYSYNGAMRATLGNGYGELAFQLGHAGAGVVFGTAWGDGMYPVYGEMHDGRIVRVYVNVG